ncbi:MAG: EAL domain-containing protein [Paraglaciecola sp.]|uniref:EAL domain-containing protein n=1 Tax=Paraglaciecola sp. TaxID=1920173 RepID=UPI00273E4045|nr:EAL domain-containing protein [Paraglaciecola sp.]MDP5033143.1 EAL domain-containing protein [Paraglaciecola sp.]MDP5130211.1 EAL domain-containing protein [Paraglaciecola sp.]
MQPKSQFLFLYLLLMTLFSAPLYAENKQSIVQISHSDSRLNLLNRMSWMVTDSHIQLSDTQLLENWQQTLPKGPLASHQSIWGRLELDFNYSSQHSYFFTIGNPQLDYVDLYLLDDKNRILSSYLLGANREFDKRPINHRLFVVPLTPSQQGRVKVYIKITDDGPLVVPIELSTQASTLAKEQLVLVAIGYLGGGLSLLAAYFLLTYIFLRSPIRFWFAISCGLYLLLSLNISGFIAQLIGVSAYISHTNNALFGLLLLSTAKVCFVILERVPTFWRYCSYLIGFLTIFSSLIQNSYQQITGASFLALLEGFLLIVLALFYHKKDKALPNLVGLIALTIISTISIIQVSLFISGTVISNSVTWFFTLASVGAIMMIALAIEAHERVLVKRQQIKQQSAITDLQHFYDLFRNSAEGLYTSTLDGKLISVNPAMCNLFGYDSEEQLIESVTNTSQFYAEPRDRELLLGELYQNGKVIGKELRGLRKDGSEFWFCISTQIKQENTTKYMFGSIFDITERKQSNISLEFLATHDSLTGVFNRREFEKRLSNGLQEAQKNNSELTLLYMDLDQFKVVNDTCGHKAGDVLIKQLAQKLQDVVQDKGLLARLGGDEFGVLLLGDNAQMAYLLANKLLNTVKEFRFIWENRIFTLGVSIGQVPWFQDIKTPEQLLSMADSACYLAKEMGRNQIHTYSFHDKQMQRYESEITWVSDINYALQHDCFVLYYQHYQSLQKSASGHHYEILLRMLDQDNNIIAPNAFLPAAERYNLTSKIDRWVVEHYFSWLQANPEHQEQLTRCNINLSGHSLADKDLKLFILNAFEKHSIPYHKICFEITESMAIVKMDETLEFINTFHRLGCQFSLDDFGSGFSSYSYLKTLPVDQVKIDGSFVKDILLDPIDMAMVNSINDVAKAMGMETVAEFVESSEILVELGKMGVDYAQGYGVAKPTSLSEFSSLS